MEKELRKARIRVTRLEGPSQITLGHKDPVPHGPSPSVPPGPMTNKSSGGTSSSGAGSGGGASSESAAGGNQGSGSSVHQRPARPGLDYSRWDHIDVSDDDEDDDNASDRDEFDDGMDVDGLGDQGDDRDTLDAEELARARALARKREGRSKAETRMLLKWLSQRCPRVAALNYGHQCTLLDRMVVKQLDDHDVCEGSCLIVLQGWRSLRQ